MLRSFFVLVITLLIYPTLGFSSEYSDRDLYPEYSISHISPTHIGLTSIEGYSLKIGNLLFASKTPFDSFEAVDSSSQAGLFNNKKHKIGYKRKWPRYYEIAESPHEFNTKNGQIITVTNIPFTTYEDIVQELDKKRGIPKCDAGNTEQIIMYGMYSGGVTQTIKNPNCRDENEISEKEKEQVRAMLPKTRSFQVTMGSKSITLKYPISYYVDINVPLLYDVEYVDKKLWVLAIGQGHNGYYLSSIRIYDLQKGVLLKELDKLSAWPANIIMDPYRPVVWVAAKGRVYKINRNNYEVSSYNTSLDFDNKFEKTTIELTEQKEYFNPLAVLSYEIDKSIRKEFIRTAKTIRPKLHKEFSLYHFYMGIKQQTFPSEFRVIKPFITKMYNLLAAQYPANPNKLNRWSKVLQGFYDESSSK